MKVLAFAGRMGSGKNLAAQLVARRRSVVEIALADELKRVAIDLFKLTPAQCFGDSAARNVALKTPIGPNGIVLAESILRCGRHKELFAKANVSVKTISVRLLEVFNQELPDGVKTPRRVLQLLGTEWGRSLYDAVWLEALHNAVRAVRYGANYDPVNGLSGLSPENGLPKSKEFVVVTDCRFPNEAKYLREQMGASVVWIDADARLPPRPENEHSSEPRLLDLAPYVSHIVKNETTVKDFEGVIETLLATL